MAKVIFRKYARAIFHNVGSFLPKTAFSTILQMLKHIDLYHLDCYRNKMKYGKLLNSNHVAINSASSTQPTTHTHEIRTRNDRYDYNSSFGNTCRTNDGYDEIDFGMLSPRQIVNFFILMTTDLADYRIHDGFESYEERNVGSAEGHTKRGQNVQRAFFRGWRSRSTVRSKCIDGK